MKKMFLFVLLILAAALAPAAPAVDPGPGEGAFGEALDVRVVSVEATVTDRQGRRVEGLTASDFRLLVDGREVPVDYFNEVRNGELAGSAAEPGGREGTSYLLFIDDSFSIAAQRNMVLARLQRSLRLGSEDRMSVVSFDGRRLALLSDWTGDEGALRRTLEQAKGRRSWGILKVAAPRTSAFGEMDLRTLEETADATAAASAAMRSLTPPPGRKVLLLLSGGWPTVSALNEQGIRSDRLPSVGDDERFEKMFEPLTGTANLLGYTVYPVDVPGVESTGPDASDFRPRGSGLSSARELSVQANLEYIARQTGGVAMINSTRLEAFDRVERDVRSYYSMGFSPEWRADGRHHQIRVEVRRPGLKVRARDGFTDLSPRMEASLRSGEALWGE